MQQVRVKEQNVARLHFDVDQLQDFLGFMHAFQIGACLVARQNVIYAAHLMRSFKDLHAAVLPGCGIDRNKGAGE